MNKLINKYNIQYTLFEIYCSNVVYSLYISDAQLDYAFYDWSIYFF